MSKEILLHAGKTGLNQKQKKALSEERAFWGWEVFYAYQVA